LTEIVAVLVLAFCLPGVLAVNNPATVITTEITAVPQLVNETACVGCMLESMQLEGLIKKNPNWGDIRFFSHDNHGVVAGYGQTFNITTYVILNLTSGVQRNLTVYDYKVYRAACVTAKGVATEADRGGAGYPYAGPKDSEFFAGNST